MKLHGTRTGRITGRHYDSIIANDPINAGSGHMQYGTALHKKIENSFKEYYKKAPQDYLYRKLAIQLKHKGPKLRKYTPELTETINGFTQLDKTICKYILALSLADHMTSIADSANAAINLAFLLSPGLRKEFEALYPSLDSEY